MSSLQGAPQTAPSRHLLKTFQVTVLKTPPYLARRGLDLDGNEDVAFFSAPRLPGVSTLSHGLPLVVLPPKILVQTLQTRRLSGSPM